jgi:hypothetical protein
MRGGETMMVLVLVVLVVVEVVVIVVLVAVAPMVVLVSRLALEPPIAHHSVARALLIRRDIRRKSRNKWDICDRVSLIFESITCEEYVYKSIII